MQVTLYFNACIWSSMLVFNSLHFNTCIFGSMHVFDSMYVYLIQCISSIQCMYNVCIVNLMHVYSITVLVPALPVVSVSELFPELSLIVTATGKETYAFHNYQLSFVLANIGSKIFYLLGYYNICMVLGYSRA